VTSEQDYVLLPAQAEFLADTITLNVCFVGGMGSGKSNGGAKKAVDLALLNPGEIGLIASTDFSTAADTIVLQIREELETRRIPFKFNNNNLRITIRPPGQAPTVLKTVSYGQPLIGFNAAFFVADEIDTLPEQKAREAWNALSMRVRVGRVNQMCATSTPEGYRFLFRFFCDEVAKDPSLASKRRIIHASTLDNPFVPDHYIQNVFETRTPEEAKAYLFGQFVNLVGGTVYYAFNKAVNCTSRTADDFADYTMHVGMDFNAGNCNATISFKADGNSYTVAELTKIEHVPAMIYELRTKYKHWAQREGGIVIYPDSSGKSPNANASLSSITLLKQAGFQCVYNGNNPSILKERVPAVNALFRAQQFVNGERTYLHRGFVNHVTCPTLVEGLEQQAFDPSTGLPDKRSGHDHCLDAFGYYVFHRFPIPEFGGRIKQLR